MGRGSRWQIGIDPVIVVIIIAIFSKSTRSFSAEIRPPSQGHMYIMHITTFKIGRLLPPHLGMIYGVFPTLSSTVLGFGFDIEGGNTLYKNIPFTFDRMDDLTRIRCIRAV